MGLNQIGSKVIQEVTNSVAGNSDWREYPLDKPLDSLCLDQHGNMGPRFAAWPCGLVRLGVGWLAHFEGDWRRHLLPFVWVAGYFIWQNAMFWRYMRYFLPLSVHNSFC